MCVGVPCYVTSLEKDLGHIVAHTEGVGRVGAGGRKHNARNELGKVLVMGTDGVEQV